MITQRGTFYIKKAAGTTERIVRGIAHKIDRRKYFSKVPGNKKIRLLIEQYKFAFGVLFATIICLILTAFSVSLYVVTGTAKLDLSRPGYEDVRKKVVKSSPSQQSFDTSGPLSSKVLGDYLEDYKKQAQSISKYDTFNPQLLDDSALGLTTTATPSDGATPPN